MSILSLTPPPVWKFPSFFNLIVFYDTNYIADTRLSILHDLQVVSGPNSRVSRVCEVCHTLLSHHSAPYFSLEAPAMPE